MIREIEVFETVDGKRFDDRDKAQEHIADACREGLDARLAGLMQAGKLSANDRYRIVMALIPDVHAAKMLSANLSRWLDY